MLVRLARILLGIGCILLTPRASPAALAASFEPDSLALTATHVVVVDSQGTVLESWRGDLKPGATLPLAEFKIQLEHPVETPFGGRPPKGTPEKVTGKRLVLFLAQGGSRFTKLAHEERWGSAHWTGDFAASTAWIESGTAFGLVQWINPGPRQMVSMGSEADLKSRVEKVNTAVRERIETLRKEPDLAARAAGLVEIVRNQSGFSAHAFGELAKCGKDGLPALRSLLKDDLLGYKERIGAYRAMAQIGKPSRADLMNLMKDQIKFWHNKYTPLDIYGFGKELHEYTSLNCAILSAATENPAALTDLSDDERAVIKDLHTHFASYRTNKKFGRQGEKIYQQLDRILEAQKR